MKTLITELTEKLKKQQARAAKHQRAAERTQLEIEELKQRTEREGIVVAGIKLEYLTLPAQKVGKLKFLNFNYYGNQAL